MADLTDYLTKETLTELQEAFASVACAPVSLRDASGRSLLDEASLCDNDSPLIPIVVDGDLVGSVGLTDGQQVTPGRANVEAFLRLTADMIGRLAQRQSTLRNRISELTALYRLTSEFTGQQDLQTVLDQVTSTVVQTLHVKACAIRLLNDEGTELVVKSVANLSPEYLNKGPILLSRSKIDQEVLENLQPVYIANEQNDPRVMYPAEAKREGIVSALCAPLVYKGRAEGVIRVYTSTPHEFDWFEVSLLQAIASNAAAAIVNTRLYRYAVQGENMQRQLRLASVVQRRMIPAQSPQVEGLDIGSVYVPCFELGGDFFDFIEMDDDNLGLAMCDVVGKGVRASLLMASLRASLRAVASEVYEISDVLVKVNETFCASSLDSDFATLFYGVMDSRKHLFTYANAGHTPPLLFRDGRVQRLTVGGGVLGIEDFACWNTEVIHCQPGDVILTYTDGLSEALNFDDEEFGSQRVQQAASSAIEQGFNADGIVKHVLWEMRRFAGLQKRFDDLTIVALVVGNR